VADAGQPRTHACRAPLSCASRRRLIILPQFWGFVERFQHQMCLARGCMKLKTGDAAKFLRGLFAPPSVTALLLGRIAMKRLGYLVASAALAGALVASGPAEAFRGGFGGGGFHGGFGGGGWHGGFGGGGWHGGFGGWGRGGMFAGRSVALGGWNRGWGWGGRGWGWRRGWGWGGWWPGYATGIGLGLAATYPWWGYDYPYYDYSSYYGYPYYGYGYPYYSSGYPYGYGSAPVVTGRSVVVVRRPHRHAYYARRYYGRSVYAHPYRYR
jgi:hypothetical protein